MKLKSLFLAASCLLITCCQSINPDSTEIIPINTDKIADYRDVIDSQELIELSNVPEGKMNGLWDIRVFKDYFLCKDNNEILYLFKKNGTFVSNSKKIIGKGKGECSNFYGYSYNEASKLIELSTVEGILFYDINFHFIKKVTYQDVSLKNNYFNFISDIDDCHHLLLTYFDNLRDSAHYYIFDSKENKLLAKTYYPRDCGYISMQHSLPLENNFVAFPSVNYTFYTLDKNFQLNTMFRMDVGAKELVKSDYEDLKEDLKIRMFLRKASKSMPLKSYMSGNTFVSVIREGEESKRDNRFYTMIMNMKTKQYTCNR